jgi:lysophospholipase L1-like esterase
MAKTLSHLIAVGDSMSIDMYPHLDLHHRTQEPSTAVGSASLLFHNHDLIWPEFAGRDLTTCHPGIEYVNLAADGATTADLLACATASADHAGSLTGTTCATTLDTFQDSRAVVTVTIGGNDALAIAAKFTHAGPGTVQQEIMQLLKRYDGAIDTLTQRLRQATFILTTVFDPTDGTGVLPGYRDNVSKLPVQLLAALNQHIKQVAGSRQALLADVHAHFLGHGTKAAPEDRWYWQPSPIEPSALGASEIRRVWLDTLAKAGLVKT